MGENTNISWADHTFNPWIGCTKVSPGCANCYAEEMMDTRYGKARWGKGQPRVRTSAANWKLPLRWNRQLICDLCSRPFVQLTGRQKLCEPILGDPCKSCNGIYRRPRVFCASLADWLDDEVPIEWLADLLKLIHETPNLDWLLLTKRPENFIGRVGSLLSTMFMRDDWRLLWLEGRPPPNIWIGTSVEDQKRADERIPELLKIPARVRFLSVEPMLEAIDFRHSLGPVELESYSAFNSSAYTSGGIAWCIFGGESGPKSRPCNIEWIRDGVRQCRAAGIPPFVKQIGAVPMYSQEIDDSDPYCKIVKRLTHKVRDKKGGEMSEWPVDLRVREFPGGAE